MELKPGTRLRSVVDTTEVVVVRATGGDIDLRCGGQQMVPIGDNGARVGNVDAQFAGPTLLGKRYADHSGELELLCTKAGDGRLSIGDLPMEIKAAKPLPSSD